MAFGDQVRLIVIARAGGDRRPALGRPPCNQRALEPDHPPELLGAEADGVGKHAAQVPRRHPQTVREMVDSTSTGLFFDHLQGAASERGGSGLSGQPGALQDRALEERELGARISALRKRFCESATVGVPYELEVEDAIGQRACGHPEHPPGVSRADMDR